MPIISVKGAIDGPTMVVDGGVHGDELEGVEASIGAANSIDPATLRGTLLTVPVVNMPAFVARARSSSQERYTPGDINRVFPGNSRGSLTDRIAAFFVENVLTGADYLLDIHSGGDFYVQSPKICYEDTGDAAFDKKTEAFARVFGVDLLWRNIPGNKGMLTAAAAEMGIHAAEPELGGSERAPDVRRAYVRRVEQGIRNCLTHAGMLEGSVEPPASYTIVEGACHVSTTVGGFMEYDESVVSRGNITEGQRLGEVRDVLGDTLEEIFAPWSGVVTILRTMPTVNAGDWFIGVGPVAENVQG
jgi:predicted deacylase